MQRITQQQMTKLIKSCVTNKIPFTFKITNERQEFFSSIGNYMNKESQFPAKELNFIKQVKHYIIKNELYKTIPNNFKNKKAKKKIKYYSYSNKYKTGTAINDVLEVDLNKAYFEMLNMIGLLSEKLYKQGIDRNKISKKTLLASVGSLAKRTESFHFDGEKEIKLPDKKSKLTEHIWHYICNEVGKIMDEAAKRCGNDFIFFWVDAMFIKASSLEIVKSVFAEHGYNFSIEKCKFIQFQDKNLLVKGKGKWVEVDGKPYFSTERLFPYKPTTIVDIFKDKNIIK